MTTLNTDFGKPLPEPTALARPFWTALRNRQVHLQLCSVCGHFNHPPRITCPKCHGKAFAWTEVSPSGTVYSYTIVHRAPMPCFKVDVPYVVVLVNIDGTPARLLSNLLALPSQVHIGMRVDVVFEPASDEITLFKFVPAAVTKELPHAQH